jgi:hypothetical protein
MDMRCVPVWKIFYAFFFRVAYWPALKSAGFKWAASMIMDAMERPMQSCTR